MLQHAIEILTTEATRLATLPEKDGDRLRDLHLTIRLLSACRDAGLTHPRGVRVLPGQGTTTVSSEYRVIEDHESDDRAHWREVETAEGPFRMNGGDIVLSLRR